MFAKLESLNALSSKSWKLEKTFLKSERRFVESLYCVITRCWICCHKSVMCCMAVS